MQLYQEKHYKVGITSKNIDKLKAILKKPHAGLNHESKSLLIDLIEFTEDKANEAIQLYIKEDIA